MKYLQREDLGPILLRLGYIKEEDLREALEVRGIPRDRVGSFMLSEGLVSEVQLARALAEQFQLEYVDLGAAQLDPELIKDFPLETMQRYNFLPYQRKGGRIAVIISDPSNLAMIDDLKLLLDHTPQLHVGTRSGIQQALINAFKKGPEFPVMESATFKRVTEEEEEGVSEAPGPDESPIIKLVDTIILNAIHRRASDIHIESNENQVVVKYRIDGLLYPAMEPIPKRQQNMIISRIKVMAELDIAERRVPQDGRFKLKLKQKPIDFRVSIMPSIHGEDAVIRILDKETISSELEGLKLENLGFPDFDLRRFRRNINRPYGMILVTGPTGSGKTTTLYAAISEILRPEDKVITIEDPVEYQLNGVTQIPVNEKKGLTFARGLRSILRHDPDKIMVGEIRDPETALIAVQAALTGHLVFTTVHANNVTDVIGRLMSMGVDPYNLVSSLNCILTQRLVRAICKACKQPVKISPKTLEENGLDPQALKDHIFYEGAGKGVGCQQCNGTGYRGRTGIFELLEINDHLRNLIMEKRSAAEIREAGKVQKMTFLRGAAIEKFLAGITTLAEVNRVTTLE